MSTLGMIGLGQMGLPMSRNLIEAGHTVVGYRRGDASAFAALGGTPAGSAREVAERCDVVFSCIPDDAALEAIVSGPEGIARGDLAGKLLVELSTLSGHAKSLQARRIEDAGGRMLDGAISGLPRMVAERQGVFFVSGEENSFESVKQYLDALSSKVFFMGAFGNAVNAKLCANMLVAINVASSAEALAFGSKLGIPPERLVAALKDGAGASLQFTARAGRMVRGDWDQVMGSTALLNKDVHLIEAKAREADCPVPLLDAAAQIYEQAMERGYGQKDVAAIYAVVADAAGVSVPVAANENRNPEVR